MTFEGESPRQRQEPEESLEGKEHGGQSWSCSYRQQETTDPGPVGQCELKIVESSYLHGVGIGIAGVW